MDTQDVANRLVTLCRNGKFVDAIDELYHNNIVSREMPGYPLEIAKGKDTVKQKSLDWENNIVAFHNSEISNPLVAGDHFSVTMKMDVTFKDRGRQLIEEVCVYEVKDGKITAEQFFYTM